MSGRRETDRYDVAVVGLGVMGLAAAAALARRGARVIGIEQFAFAHSRGSSHGQSRIIRRAYPEDPGYQPLLEGAYAGWAALEEDAGTRLFHRCGFLASGPEGGDYVTRLADGYRRSGLPYEVLDPEAVRRRFPLFRIPDHHIAFQDPLGGILETDACLRALRRRAEQSGARLRFDSPVVAWGADGHGAWVETASERFTAGTLVITAGAWAGPLLAAAGLPLRIWRRVLSWHRGANGAMMGPARFPAFVIDLPQGGFYGCPALDDRGIKVGEHNRPWPVATPEAIDGTLDPAEAGLLRDMAGAVFPDLDPVPVATERCLYTVTPDRHFVIDRHPGRERVWIGAGFSGHGFKFAPVIGTILADLALEGRTRLPIGMFGLGRFGTGLG